MVCRLQCVYVCGGRLSLLLLFFVVVAMHPLAPIPIFTPHIPSSPMSPSRDSF